MTTPDDFTTTVSVTDVAQCARWLQDEHNRAVLDPNDVGTVHRVLTVLARALRSTVDPYSMLTDARDALPFCGYLASRYRGELRRSKSLLERVSAASKVNAYHDLDRAGKKTTAEAVKSQAMLAPEVLALTDKCDTLEQLAEFFYGFHFDMKERIGSLRSQMKADNIDERT